MIKAVRNVYKTCYGEFEITYYIIYNKPTIGPPKKLQPSLTKGEIGSRDHGRILNGKYLIYHKKVSLFLIYHNFFWPLSHIP
jgi:hypothetical protein